MHKIRVVLGDDHTLFRAGLRKLLDGIQDIEVVGEASDGKEVVRLAHTLHPDDDAHALVVLTLLKMKAHPHVDSRNHLAP